MIINTKKNVNTITKNTSVHSKKMKRSKSSDQLVIKKTPKKIDDYSKI